ncbi:hypothetical protein M8J76_002312 [Diaphorina citri]|nr:hypothetical protein M8J75_001504 [Diaphorina citri]KAI5740272.1 hypothetical protein M8J76_002312 [Diaphorina citri]
MWFFYILSWFAIFLQICFVVLATAAGLYYLAELVEEYSVLAKKVIQWLIIITLLIYAGFFCFEDLPTILLICGVLAQVLHLIIIQNFPYVSLTSPAFIAAVVLIVVNHYYAMSYFQSNYHSFAEVMAFFTLCLWLVPFSLLVSLSANDMVLPTVAETRPLLSDNEDVITNYFSRRAKKYGLLSFFNYAKESILPQRSKKVF